jgi:hypothetical protein
MNSRPLVTSGFFLTKKGAAGYEDFTDFLCFINPDNPALRRLRQRILSIKWQLRRLRQSILLQ